MLELQACRERNQQMAERLRTAEAQNSRLREDVSSAATMAEAAKQELVDGLIALKQRWVPILLRPCPPCQGLQQSLLQGAGAGQGGGAAKGGGAEREGGGGAGPGDQQEHAGGAAGRPGGHQ